MPPTKRVRKIEIGDQIFFSFGKERPTKYEITKVTFRSAYAGSFKFERGARWSESVKKWFATPMSVPVAIMNRYLLDTDDTEAKKWRKMELIEQIKRFDFNSMSESELEQILNKLNTNKSSDKK